MKLDQPIQVVQATSMNISSCLAVMVKNKEEEGAQELVLQNAKEVEQVRLCGRGDQALIHDEPELFREFEEFMHEVDAYNAENEKASLLKLRNSTSTTLTQVASCLDDGDELKHTKSELKDGCKSTTDLINTLDLSEPIVQMDEGHEVACSSSLVMENHVEPPSIEKEHECSFWDEIFTPQMKACFKVLNFKNPEKKG